MKDDVVEKEKLSGPQLAVQSYLDELLQEATAEFQESVDEQTSASSIEAVKIETVKEESKTESQIEKATLEPTKAADAALGENVVSTSDDVEVISSVSTDDIGVDLPISIEDFDRVTPTADSQDVIAPSQELIPENADSDVTQLDNESEQVNLVEVEPKAEKEAERPWNESRFECLLFNVGGLKIAVPLVELGGIQKADKSTITSIFGQPDWFIGISSVNDLRIRTVDTAKWVMPNHYKGELTSEFQFIIQLDRSSWGLACEEVAEAITLEPSEVKWRTDRTKRPWLAGTVIKHMCAILDVQGFINLLDDPENGFNPSTLK
ncbi:chemotaxis protein CheW [Marinomonas agarivorans]|nr:chemotaxis protein CheW [Marinomonas agarivorans]